MNKGTAKRIAVMIRRRLFSLLKYPKFPLDTFEDVFALLCFFFCFKTRMTVWTVVTVVGCLPACKSMVNLIMILKCRPMDAGLYQKIHEHQGSLDMAYELYMTFYEKSAYIDASIFGSLL